MSVVATMTMNFDAQGDISYHKNKAGDFPRTESKSVHLSCIAKGLMVKCIKHKMQDSSGSPGSIK